MSRLIVEMTNITGEETLTDYMNQISCRSMRHGVDMPVVPNATDRTEGASVHGSITMDHEIDKATPMLREACAKGTNISDVKITRIKVVGGVAQAADITTLKTAKITSVIMETPFDAGTGMPDEQPVETFNIDYAEIKWEHKEYVNGLASSTVSGEYDTDTLTNITSIA